MNDALMLPVSHKGAEYEFPLTIAAGGYSPRYKVLVEGVEVLYERDDHGAFRAIVYNPDEAAGPLPDRSLLEAISAVLQEITA